MDPTDPDELEQRQGLDGNIEDDAIDAPPGEPLDPDELEQRQVIPDEDDDYDRG